MDIRYPKKRGKNNMKTLNIKIAGLFVTTALLLAGIAQADLPFNNLQGVGGAAFNPLAYPSGNAWNTDKTSTDEIFKPENIFSKPQFGAWYVNLGDVDVNWTAFGVSETLFKRLELSYGHEVISPAYGPSINKDNLGAKLLLIKENEWDSPFVPAVSVGAILKKTSDTGAGVDDTGSDFYLVATKLITQTPKPVVISGGVLSTDARATGVFGYDDDRDVTLFGNVDVVLHPKVAIGAEYKQGADFGSYKDADYWDAHVVFFPNNNLSIIAAYVNAGDEKSTSKVGLGDGFVLSAQYKF